MRNGEPCETFPLTLTNDLTELRGVIEEIAHYESCITKNMINCKS